MLRSARNIARLVRIARTLARHDALFPLEQLGVAPALIAAVGLIWRRRVGKDKRPGERLAASFEALGPSFIKLGQALATRPDLMGEEAAADLSSLQDRLPPFAGAEARATIEAQLGAPVGELYESFEDVPVAAASIAQVHFAVTKGGTGDGNEGAGEEVAVKVLRPGIEDAFARDLDLFHWLAGLAALARPDLRRLKPVEIVDAFAETVRVEMDLRMEAAAASELAENFVGDPGFRVPRVDWRRTAQRVLTLERIAGIRIDDRKALVAAGRDPDKVLENASRTFFRQVFRDGFFHADQHPGNMFVAEDDSIIAVDFGIMGRLDRRTRAYLADMLLGFLTADYRMVAEVHFRAGYVPADKSVDAFTQACRAIAEPIMGRPLSEISLARLLGLLFQVTETFEMETQPQLLLLQKTMLVTEGVGRTLNPAVNMWELARPLIEDWMRESRGPEARVRTAAADISQAVERLPSIMADAEAALARYLREGTADGQGGGATRNSPGGSRIWPIWLALAVLAAAILAGL
jgi:ubiquinone biosynthesis protein